MASQALYRKWRSQTFDEIVSQEHVVRTLRNALRDGRVGHAYLFTGPRGTGKTSMARLLAKAVNCIGETDEKPCNQCPICISITEGRALDLIEIDAASNRGIDEVRDLREKVRFRPNECRYRVYIMDEAHMLTTPAFNALLKTLEEPPEHAIFVLVTTEPQNIPITILSRCQRFDFHRIPLAQTVSHLRQVSDEEGLDIADDALELVARQATGSMRDALSLLDQLMAFRQEHITVGRIHEILGTAPEVALRDIVQAILDGNAGAGLRALNDALDQGADSRQLCKDLIDYLRSVLVLKVGGEPRLLNVTTESLGQIKGIAQQLPLERLLDSIRSFNQAGLDLKGGIHPRLPLEIALLSSVMGPQAAAPGNPLAAPDKSPAAPDKSPAASESQAAPANPQAAPGNSQAAPGNPQAAPGNSQAAPDRSRAARERAPAQATAAEEAPSDARATTETSHSASTAPAVKPPERKQRKVPVRTEERGVAARGSKARADTRPSAANASGPAPTLAWFQENWDGIVTAVRARNRSVVALLNRSCEPVDVKNGVLILGFYHDFHRQKVEQPKNLEILQEAISDVLGRPLGVKCVPFRGDANQRAQEQDDEGQQELAAKVAESDPIVKEAVEKFGAQVTSVRPREE